MNTAATRPTVLGMAVLSASAPVVSPRDFYQGQLFLALFLALALSIVMTSINVWWAEKRMAGRPFWQVLLISAGLSMILVGSMLLTLGSLHSVRNQAVFGAPEAFPAIRSLIPVALVATFVYVLIQCRSSRRRRVASGVFWLLLAAAATQCWVLAMSFSVRVSSADLWHWDMAALRWKMPIVIVLPLAGAVLGLLTRMGTLRRVLRFVPVVAYVAAVGVFFWPVRYPTMWRKADIGPLLGAYVNSAGDLILQARPVPQRALGTGFEAVLVRPNGRELFRAVCTQPARADVWRPIFSPDLHCVDLRTAVPLLERMWGGYDRSLFVELSSATVLESATGTLQTPLEWRRRVPGPGRSWYSADYDSAKGVYTIRGGTTRGDHFFGPHQYWTWEGGRRWFDGSKVHLFSTNIQVTKQRKVGSSLVTGIVTIDLERGQVSMQPLGTQAVSGIASVSPDGHRFVATARTYLPSRVPCFTYRLFEASGEGRMLGPPCRDQEFIPVWLEGGDPLLLPACEVAGAMAEASLRDAWRSRETWSDGREIGGRIFIGQGPEYGPRSETRHAALFELARDGKHARAIVAGPVSVQWLPDSIVWCEQTTKGGRVVRFYPGDDRYEVLLSIP